jgi:hypothetical protein
MVGIVQSWNRNKAKPKTAAVPTPAQQDQIKQARSRYAKDRRAFFRDCLRIRDRDSPDAKLSPLVLNLAQENLLTTVERIERFNLERLGAESHGLPVDIVVAKPRKEGISTLIEALAFHYCEFRPHSNVLVMAHRKDGAQNIGKISKRFNDFIPRDHLAWKVDMGRIADDVLEWGQFQGQNWDSRMIIATSKDEGVARGFDFNFVHLSEVAHFPSSDAISASKNAMVAFHYCFEESTANGIDSSFYASWHGALSFDDVYSHWKSTGRVPDKWNGKYRFFWAWWQDPHYTQPVDPIEAAWLEDNLDDDERAYRERFGLDLGQLKWRRYTIKTKCSEQRAMSPEDFFRQEYPAFPEEMFVGSGNRVFDEKRLIEMAKSSEDVRPLWHGRLRPVGDGTCLEEPSTSSNFRYSPMIIWQQPVAGHEYVIGADAAEGKEHGDNSVASVWDRTDGTRLVEVARYMGKTSARDLGDVLFHLGRKYNEAYLIPERSPPGNVTCQRLVDLQYARIYHAQNEELVGGSSSPNSFTPGFRTMKNTKRMIIEEGQSAVKQGQITILHPDAVNEWRMYQNTDGRLAAPDGEHDDCVMADCLAVYAHFQAAPPVILRGRQQEQRLLDSDGKPLDGVHALIAKKKEAAEKVHRRMERVKKVREAKQWARLTRQSSQ